MDEDNLWEEPPLTAAEVHNELGLRCKRSQIHAVEGQGKIVKVWYTPLKRPHHADSKEIAKALKALGVDVTWYSTVPFVNGGRALICGVNTKEG